MKNLSIATLLFLLATQAHAACEYPARAKIANGSTATKEEMLESQREVKTYMAAMDVYLECIEEEEKQAREELEEPSQEELVQRTEILNKKHNAAVEEMEIVAAEFNEQVRLYKAQSD